VKLSLCNEVIRELPFERQCGLAAGLGYRGLELAPFTFGDDAWRMPAAKRAEVRRVCADAGIEVSGLHWLLAAPAGLSITTSDRTVWQKSVDVFARLGRSLCRAGWRLSGARLAGAAPREDARRCLARRGSLDPGGRAGGGGQGGLLHRAVGQARLQFRQHARRGSRDRPARRQSGAAHHGRHAGRRPDGIRAGGRRHQALDADRPCGPYPIQ